MHRLGGIRVQPSYQVLIDGLGEEWREWRHDFAEGDEHLVDGRVGRQLIGIVLLNPRARPDELDIPAG